tara:strand:- start:75 stop:410 length:336 start_codon:yes stop_codon:yes gene_type:complete
MQKTKIFLTILIFGLSLGITSIIKTQTMIIEKKITKLELNITDIKKNLHEAQLDFFYLTSPANLERKIKLLSFKEYSPMDYSRIFLNYNDFITIKKNITNKNIKNEKKIKE